MKVLGIDPGLRNMGWGIIQVDGSRIRHVANGVIHSDGDQTLGARLSVLFRGLCAVIATHQPDEAAVEQTFVNKDATGTLKLGQARGVALLAPAEAGITVGAVSYLASQPWPFPASLMIGCRGEATSTEITVDPTELQEALWVTREDMMDVFAGSHPKIR